MHITRWARLSISIAVLVVLAFEGLLPAAAYADITACSALFSAPDIQPGITTNLNLQVNNDGPDAIAWMRVTRPSDSFTVVGASSQDWTTAYADDSATFTDSTIDGGVAYNKLYLQLTASADEAAAATWTVQVSSDPSGINPLTCDNAGLDVAISDGTGPFISGIGVTAILPRSVTIGWTTDEFATSQVVYGPTSHYGNTTAALPALTADHSVVLTGLAADTAYHYQIISNDAAGNTMTSGDGTFLTTSESTTAPVTAAALPLPLTTRIAILDRPAERTPPSVTLTTTFTKAFKTAPQISGTASDNLALADVLYSTDGGRNWLPVDSISGLGSRTASFSFTPHLSEDGNYPISLRAIDTSGNSANSPAVTLVIDRLDPIIGGSLLSQGPQLLTPSVDGTISVMTGVDQKLTVSAVGGPTSITVSARLASGQPGTKNSKPASYSLTKSIDSGLWSGIVSLPTTGRYDLVAHAIDGAANTSTQDLLKLQVSSPAQLINQKNSKPIRGTVTLYYLEPESHSWVVWDGASYNQTNPQPTDNHGNYSLFVPPGKYYLKATASGFRTGLSSIFDISQSSPLISSLALQPEVGLRIGGLHITWPLSTISHNQQTTLTTVASYDSTNQLIGKTAPNFTLKGNDGSVVHTVDLLGKPTVLTFAASWIPSGSEQLKTLSQLQSNGDINAVAIAVEENAPKILAYNAISGSDVRWLVDPDGSLSQTYGAPALPTHYILDRKGIVRQVISGVLTKQQLLADLSGF